MLSNLFRAKKAKVAFLLCKCKCIRKGLLSSAVCLSFKCVHCDKTKESAADIFTALHICRAVFPIAKVSVCLSVTCTNCDKTNESSAEILIPYERKIHVVFRTNRMVGGGHPLLPEILDQTDPPSFKNGDFHSIFARSGSTVGASEKSSL